MRITIIIMPAIGLLLAASTVRAGDAGMVYVSSLGSNEVLRYNSTTGAYIDTFVPAASGGLSQPHGILERCDDILVAGFGNHQVLRYDRQTGAFLDVFIPSGGGLSQPTYLQYGPDGNLYLSSQGSDEIRRYTPDGAALGPFVTAGSGGLDGPSGFAFGPDERLYVAGRYSASVIAYNGVTGAFDEVVADSSDGLIAGSTFGLTFGDNGDLYFVSGGTIYRYDLDTAAIIAAIPVGGAIGLEPGPAGGVYVATNNNLRVISTSDDSLSGPVLSGGTISTLNFFRFPASTPAPGCAPVPASSAWALFAMCVLLLIAGTLAAGKPGNDKQWHSATRSATA